MLAKNDVEWLEARYSQLSPNAEGTKVAGALPFAGAYEKTSNKFTLIEAGDTSKHTGIILSGSYNIAIEKSPDPERLPRLYVNDETLPHIADRHFYPNQTNQPACVCGIVEEARFLSEGFDFKKYLEEYVIPFLYGQKYYDAHGEWPWRDYAHDTAGALESYFFDGSPEFISTILKQLRAMTGDWERVKSILESIDQPKGHILCFCKRHDHIRRCHPDAWRGLIKFHTNLRNSRISIV